ncbi:MAG: hypothetical protein V7K97_15520 [Nostoc sp.]|uniref:hypothetical protein n=1 Tax=Nostoc sp. TaxID=1180 RepID=UPI002FF4674E
MFQHLVEAINFEEFVEWKPENGRTEREEPIIQLFAPLSVSERGWGRGQIRLVELTLYITLEKY